MLLLDRNATIHPEIYRIKILFWTFYFFTFSGFENIEIQKELHCRNIDLVSFVKKYFDSKYPLSISNRNMTYIWTLFL